MKLALALSAALACGSFLSAQTVRITEYPVTTSPPNSPLIDIASGPDGLLYVPVDYANAILRITTAGVATQIALPGQNYYSANHVTAGPDGAVWYTRVQGTIGRIPPSGPITEFSVPGSPALTGIAKGPDGALWFSGYTYSSGVSSNYASQGVIGRLTTSGTFTLFSTPLTPNGITSGPDGALWFTENLLDAYGNASTARIGRITTAGVVTEYPVPTSGAYVTSITTGPDGALWFDETSGGKIGRITTSGVVSEFPLPSPRTFPHGIAVGGDGALWFGEAQAGQVGRITTSGSFNEYRAPSTGADPIAVALGADGGIWFAEYSNGQVLRVGLGIVTQSLPSSPSNAAYPSTTLQAQAGTVPYTWSATGLPSGLTLSSGGVLSGVPSTPGTYSPTITVTDASNPQQTARASYSLTITQGAAPPLVVTASCPATSGVTGQAYSFPVGATGGTPPYTWVVASGSLPPGLTLASGTGVIGGTPTTAGTYPFSIQVRDSAPSAPQQATYACSIVIGQGLTITNACPVNAATVGQAYGLTLTASGGSPSYSWTLTGGSLPPGLQLNQATGAITGTPTAAGSFQITAQATDNAGAKASFTCSLVVRAALAIPQVCPVSAGVVGQAYSLPLSATGGVGPYSWTLSSGSLPSGLALDPATGLISGSAAVAGSFPFTVQVTDSAGGRASFSCSLTFSTVLRVTTGCPTAPLTVNQPYTLQLGATGGVLPYGYWTLNSGSLPPGLSLDPVSGLISGTPTTSGTYAFAAQVVDSGLQRATFSCSLVVNAARQTTLSCPSAQGTLGQPYSSGVVAAGGYGPYVFSLVSGSLPTGLSLNPTSGMIGGTALVSGSSSFTVQAIDTGIGETRQTASVSCSITIGSLPLQITSGCPAAGATQGTPYLQTLGALGGGGPISWAISVGSLPDGLSLAGNRIFGTPTGPPGTTKFSISANTPDQFAEINCSITVTGPGLQISSGCPVNGTQGAPYGPFPLSATGGTAGAPYVFSIVNGTLPPGLSLSGNSISGTPQGPAGSSAFQIQVTNGSQTATMNTCSLTIAPPALSVTGTCPTAGQVGTALSIPFTVAGGQTPYKLQFTGPAWFNLNGNAVTGTPPTAGPASFSVTVSDASNGPGQIFACSFPVKPPGLAIMAACPTEVPLGPINLPISGSGGQGSYSWTLAGPGWLSLSANTGTALSLVGAAPAAGSYPFTITLADSAGSTPAVFSCTLVVSGPSTPPLTISATGGCPAARTAFLGSYTLPFSASGGNPPYSWTYSGPSFLALSSAMGQAVSLTGTGQSAGLFPFSVTVTDSANSSAVFECAIAVDPAVIPALSLSGLTAPANPFTPIPAILSLASPTPVTLTGTVRLTFTPNATNALDNPQVHFSDPCLRLCTFTIPAGSTTFGLPNIETGTVAGTIHLEVIALSDAGRDVLTLAHPSGDIVVARSKPVITSLTFENETGNGFDIVLSGYSTPRDVTSATVTIGPKAGGSLSGTTQFTLDLSNLFNGFYQSSRSSAGGSLFTGLRIPVTVSGSKDNIGSVTVTLSNSTGASDPATKAR